MVVWDIMAEVVVEVTFQLVVDVAMVKVGVELMVKLAELLLLVGTTLSHTSPSDVLKYTTHHQKKQKPRQSQGGFE